MVAVKPNKKPGKERAPRQKITLKLLFRQKTLIFMSFPFLIWLIIFAYIPLWSWIMAFQDYKPALGIFGSPMVGMKHFVRLFSDEFAGKLFREAFRNSVGQSVYLLLIGFTMPIVFALLLNEVKARRFKKITQTISYLPHFVSWVITASILTLILNKSGTLNAILMSLGLIDKPIGFLSEAKAFWPLLGITDTWKEVGWNAIIYLAAISGIDQTLYEAASVDGAGRWRKMFHITLPSIMPTIIILLVLNIGGILNVGFERQKLLGNPTIQTHSVTIDQYALEYGLQMARYSYGTAVGIFKSVISLMLLFFANSFARRVDSEVF